MYVKCPKIQSMYFVNRDIYMYIGSIALSQTCHLFQAAHFNRFHVIQNTIWIALLLRFHYTTLLNTLIELDPNKIFLKFYKIVFFVK